jgi:WD40 repeat protein
MKASFRRLGLAGMLLIIVATATAQQLKERATLKGLKNNIDVLAVSPDGKTSIAGGSYGAGGELKLWDLSTGKERPGLASRVSVDSDFMSPGRAIARSQG